MLFFKIVLAWFFFCLGFVNLLAEAYRLGIERFEKDNHSVLDKLGYEDNGFNSSSFIFSKLLRVFVFALFLGVWYWLLFA
ncbi:MAG: hypothetical protein COV29_02495 [Candidatus Yanofskybacteria bacterium CG10_big_fil_rev_8_21_14_0_10_36_16]|uniref:Uncharacterized protein n=1 Tax=Candidatus Yanofskybacteria bacterium CG10_big_fil_rev_8_21_14_0_10_36_16 TaxID=1975096 RepID=A0A2J0QBF3_9BACT|nr:MAG: hypothetical protein COV29_02495 [Candidatus Yanofskybacteria bacterium CG10_big_fil_rev_8_21_14_0_10_36_16]